MDRTKLVVRMIAALVVFPVVTLVAFSAVVALGNSLEGPIVNSPWLFMGAGGCGIYVGVQAAEAFTDFILKN